MPDQMPTLAGGASSGTTKKTIIVVVVVVVLAIAAYIYFSPGGSDVGPGGQPADTTGEAQAPTPSPTPNEVYSYVGEVTAVGNGQITVLAKKELNLLEADATLTVKADANTQVIRRTIPRVLPEEGGEGLFKQDNISLSDISVGDQVTVVSATNVRGQTEFTASRVEALNVQ